MAGAEQGARISPWHSDGHSYSDAEGDSESGELTHEAPSVAAATDTFASGPTASASSSASSVDDTSTSSSSSHEAGGPIGSVTTTHGTSGEDNSSFSDSLVRAPHRLPYSTHTPPSSSSDEGTASARRPSQHQHQHRQDQGGAVERVRHPALRRIAPSRPSAQPRQSPRPSVLVAAGRAGVVGVHHDSGQLLEPVRPWHRSTRPSSQPQRPQAPGAAVPRPVPPPRRDSRRGGAGAGQGAADPGPRKPLGEVGRGLVQVMARGEHVSRAAPSPPHVGEMGRVALREQFSGARLQHAPASLAPVRPPSRERMTGEMSAKAANATGGGVAGGDYGPPRRSRPPSATAAREVGAGARERADDAEGGGSRSQYWRDEGSGEGGARRLPPISRSPHTGFAGAGAARDLQELPARRRSSGEEVGRARFWALPHRARRSGL